MVGMMTASQHADDVRRRTKGIAFEGGAASCSQVLEPNARPVRSFPGTGGYWAPTNSRRQGSANCRSSSRSGDATNRVLGSRSRLSNTLPRRTRLQ